MVGAKQLYVLDLNGDSLPALAKDLERRFPNTKVSLSGNTH